MITIKETGGLFFQHVIFQPSIPRQVVSNMDTQWQKEFWTEICDKMGMKTALITVYHPQAN
jgi:hypothetical protein